ncbi:hypothetical protein PF002_g15441 [Phytophthora fragariae]|uniref:Uncharacterized protein n=1 Tax=Phytophthora fragariae TaxID=53985 RepID=A0A6A4DK58_9STRA|nr:hypothetical protein PF006_g12862 [Phytophthora fragariae]KAE9221905.1 hypothetical protein PF002_g15441 [Phytophthora fragariae]KAE9303627.1 hypothetical protein PF001_g13469 [Phytophthora fragariae]KAE9335743.1 hypothetical protein PF008_g13351 [Phytophthora fragariae]
MATWRLNCAIGGTDVRVNVVIKEFDSTARLMVHIIEQAPLILAAYGVRGLEICHTATSSGWLMAGSEGYKSVREEFKKNLPRKPSPDCPPLPQADLKSGRERFCDSDSSGSSYKQKETPTTKPELTSDTPPKSKQALAPTPDQTRPVNLWKKIRAKLSTRPAPSSHQRGFFKVIQRCFGGRNKIPRYKPSFLPTAELCDLIVRSFDNAILVA